MHDRLELDGLHQLVLLQQRRSWCATIDPVATMATAPMTPARPTTTAKLAATFFPTVQALSISSPPSNPIPDRLHVQHAADGFTNTHQLGRQGRRRLPVPRPRQGPGQDPDQPIETGEGQPHRLFPASSITQRGSSVWGWPSSTARLNRA